MDRQTIYAGQIPLETDQLKQSQNAMVASAKLAAAIYGITGTSVNGFTCVPTSPASLSVNITAGEIYQIENLEQSAWSSLGTDTHSILKQGLILDPVNFGITPPGTSGFSQNFLVECQYQDLDTGSTVLPYFNSSNPSVPFSGPGNAGTAQNTARKGLAALQVKAGTAATTGTQTTPTPDAGWVGLFVVTVANGASTITSGNITEYAAAPFLPATLYQLPLFSLQNKWRYAGLDTGTADALIGTVPYNGVALSLTTGMSVKLTKINSANATTTPTLTIKDTNGNATSAITVTDRRGQALTAGDLPANAEMNFFYDGTHWRFMGIVAADLGVINTEIIKQMIFEPNVVKFTTAGSFSWTVPAGITVAKIIAWGGGGGGGFSATSGGGGGGGGAYGEQTVTVTPGGTLSGTIGAGGSAATTIGSNAAGGGNTTITNSNGGTTYTAGGGAGGNSGNSTNNSVAGGITTNFNDRSMQGQPSGGTVFGYSGSVQLPYAGDGGAAPLGGVQGKGGTGGGNPGQAPGSGGAGSGASQAAGAGAAGAVWIYY